MHFAGAVVIAGTGLCVVLAIAYLLASGHPENGCSHGDSPKTSVNDRFYDKADRPAGPDAEDAALERESARPKRPTVARRGGSSGLAKPLEH